MSRGYNARRKAKRRQAQVVVKPLRRHRAKRSRRLVPVLPVLAIAAVLASVAVVGFETRDGASSGQAGQEVTALLAGIPQGGITLGSRDAPITLEMFADLECPTVKRFVVKYLPSILNTWVRTGVLKLTYHSLETDTVDEHIFFQQEAAALAAGRQNRMWNFVLTFVHEQGQKFTEYVTDRFLSDIAAQVPGMTRKRWQSDRDDSLLLRQVALGVHSAHIQHMHSTPSFSIRIASNQASEIGPNGASARKEFLVSFREDLEALRAEAVKDVPRVGVFS